MTLFNITEQHDPQFFNNHLLKFNGEGFLISGDKPQRNLLGKIIHYISRPNERIGFIRDRLVREARSLNEQLSIDEFACCYLNLSAFSVRVIQKHNAHSRYRVTDISEQTFTDLMLQVRAKTETALRIAEETPFEELIERYFLDLALVKTTCTFLSLAEPEGNHLVTYKRDIKNRYQFLMGKAIETIEDLAEKAQGGTPFTEEDERNHTLITNLLERRPLSLGTIFFHDEGHLLEIKRTFDILNEKIEEFAHTLEGYFTDIQQLCRRSDPAREVKPFTVRETVNYHLQLRIASSYFDQISNLIPHLDQLDLSDASFYSNLQRIKEEMNRIELEIRHLNLNINAPFYPALMAHAQSVASIILSASNLKRPFEEFKLFIQSPERKNIWGSSSLSTLRRKLNGFETLLNGIPHLHRSKSQFQVLKDELNTLIDEEIRWCEDRLRILDNMRPTDKDFLQSDLDCLYEIQARGYDMLPIDYRQNLRERHFNRMDEHRQIQNLLKLEEMIENSLLYGLTFEANLQIDVNGFLSSTYPEKLRLLETKKQILIQVLDIVNKQDEGILTRKDQVIEAVLALRNISNCLRLLNSHGYTRSVFIDNIQIRKLKHIETIYGHDAVTSVDEMINTLEKILVLIEALNLENISQEIPKILELQEGFPDLLKYAYLIVPSKRDVDSLSEFLKIIQNSAKTFETYLRIWENDAPPEHKEEISLLKNFACNSFCTEKLRKQIFLLEQMCLSNFHPLQTCPVSSESLIDPVKVKNEDHYYYYDKKALERWKLTCRESGRPFTDPYTRIPLREDMIEEAPEVADIIKKYYELRDMKVGDED